MEDTETLFTLTADIVAAQVRNNSVTISDLPLVIRSSAAPVLCLCHNPTKSRAGAGFGNNRKSPTESIVQINVKGQRPDWRCA